MKPDWHIGEWQREGGALSATVNREQLRISSDDAPLVAHNEALVAMSFLPAMRQGADIVTAPVNSEWHEQLQQVAALASSWWGWDSAPSYAVAAQSSLQRPLVARGHAQCFTAGLDSFYALLTAPLPSHLFYVADFEIPHASEAQICTRADNIRRVAAEFGISPLIARSNYRRLVWSKSLEWGDHLHGAGLIGTATLFSNTISALTVPSSFSADDMQPWGSHPDLDPLWVIPAVLAVRHADFTLRRSGKMARVVAEPHLLRYLTVCWRAKAGQQNCSVCRKCVRAMLMLRMHGVDAYAAGFDWSVSLPERVRQLGRIPVWELPMWNGLAQTLEDAGCADLAAACRTLVRRQRRKQLRAAYRARVRAWLSAFSVR